GAAEDGARLRRQRGLGGGPEPLLHERGRDPPGRRARRAVASRATLLHDRGARPRATRGQARAAGRGQLVGRRAPARVPPSPALRLPPRAPRVLPPPRPQSAAEGRLGSGLALRPPLSPLPTPLVH